MARIAGVSARNAGLGVKLASFNLALGVSAAGSSEGMVCAIPADVDPDESHG